MYGFARSCVCILAAICFLASSGCGRGTNEYVEPPPPNVTVAHPVERDVTDYLDSTGTTAAIESVEIRARVQGYLEKIGFSPRAKVKAGDLLFVIDPKPLQAIVHQAEAALAGKKAQLNLSQVEMDKTKELFSKDAVSELKAIEAEAQRDLAKADVDKAKADLDAAKLDLSYTRVTSPINGRVGRNLVDVGNLVGAEDKTLLTTVVNDDSIYGYFDVSELALLAFARKYAKKDSDVPPEQRLEADPTPAFLQLADEKGFPHKGRVDFADTQVDPGTGTIQVRAVFPNPSGIIIPGMFVRIRIPKARHKALLVPDVAVQADQGGRFVLVVSDKNVVEQRHVKMGNRFERLRDIKKA